MAIPRPPSERCAGAVNRPTAPLIYVNRIIAHLMNVMTAVVMPLDRLDYWDEDTIDRD